MVKGQKAGPAGTNEIGLVPLTYIEPAPAKRQAYALYDYDKQTEEELTFKEGDALTVYDDSDSEWLLVCRGGDEYGFVPANYTGDAPPSAAPAPVAAIPTPVAAIPTPAGQPTTPITKDSPLPPLPKDAFPRPHKRTDRLPRPPMRPPSPSTPTDGTKSLPLPCLPDQAEAEMEVDGPLREQATAEAEARPCLDLETLPLQMTSLPRLLPTSSHGLSRRWTDGKNEKRLWRLATA